MPYSVRGDLMAIAVKIVHIVYAPATGEPPKLMRE
jgi:hypothetical protein